MTDFLKSGTMLHMDKCHLLYDNFGFFSQNIEGGKGDVENEDSGND